MWRLRPTSLRGAAEEEADTRHWLSTEAVWCTLSSVLELSRWLSISNILLKLNMDKLLYIYFSTRLHTMNVKVASHNIYGLPQMLNIKYECKNAVMFSFEIDPFPSKIMKRNRCFLPLFAV